MTRIELQKEAVEKLYNDKRLVLSWATGVGKSFVAIDYIRKYQPQKTLLLVAEVLHKQNWKEEFEKWGVEWDSIFSQIQVECYASLEKHVNTNWDLIIMDEAHHAGSDLRLDCLKSIKAERVICLSATVDMNLIQNLNYIYGKFIVHKVSLDEAIKNNWLPEPIIYTIPCQFETAKFEQEIVETWGSTKDRKIIYCSLKESWTYRKNKKLYPNIELHIKCNEFQKLQYINSNIEYWKNRYMQTRNSRDKNKWMMLTLERKHYLGNLKTERAKKLIKSLKDKRFVCFCTDIDQCNYLGGEYAVHSNIKDRNKLIKKFNDEEIDKLFFVDMGNEGMNFYNIEVGIIIQLDGKERKPVQKSGRMLRSSEPIIYIFYYPNTRDEEFLKSYLENVDKKYVKMLKV